MSGRMAEALIPAVRAVRAKRGRQSFAVDADAVVPASGPSQLNAGCLAHYMHHIQRATGLRRVCLSVWCVCSKGAIAGWDWCLMGGGRGVVIYRVGVSEQKNTRV